MLSWPNLRHVALLGRTCEIRRAPRALFCPRDWLFAELRLTEQHAQQALGDPDQEKFNEPLAMWKTTLRLRSLLYSFFPPQHDALDGFALRHDDMHVHDTLAADDGRITGLIDWELRTWCPHF